MSINHGFFANIQIYFQVKAIKNDESSQISRLNEEIRLLKEKLMSQGEGGGGSAVVSVRLKHIMHSLRLCYIY
jgi:regulator of extracellular matrix RemA (YlzA/DUF370 family)